MAVTGKPEVEPTEAVAEVEFSNETTVTYLNSGNVEFRRVLSYDQVRNLIPGVQKVVDGLRDESTHVNVAAVLHVYVVDTDQRDIEEFI